MIPIFSDRDNVTFLPPIDADYDVERYSKNVMGGPKEATIQVKANDSDLWRLTHWARCPVKIYSDKGDPVWWGMISGIDATMLYPDRPEIGRVKVGINVDDFYDSIAVAYALVDTTDGSKSRDTTDYFTDAIGIAEYGTRQLLWSPGAASAAHAQAAGTAKLYQVRYPQPIISPAPDASESVATLTCRGWWGTLGWKYFLNAGTAIVDTGTQAGTIIAASGQFFETVFQDVTSGLSLIETKDGDNTALYYVQQLLETGTDSYLRMLVEVDQFRNVRLYEEPAKPAYPYRLLADGSFENPYGEPIRNELCPVGFWARRVDIVNMSADSGPLTDPSWVFIEEMEYSVKDDKLTHRARGDPDPWQFPVVLDG